MNCQVAGEQNDPTGRVEAFCQRGEALCVETVFEALQVFQVLLERVAYVRRPAPLAAAGLHGVQGGSVGERELVRMTLELAIAAEAEPADDADDRCGIRLKARGHGAHAEEHEFARVLKDRPDDFLPLDAELVDAFSEMRAGRGLFAFHHARGLLNSSHASTASGAT